VVRLAAIVAGTHLGSQVVEAEHIAGWIEAPFQVLDRVTARRERDELVLAAIGVVGVLHEHAGVEATLVRGRAVQLLRGGTPRARG
jgi:hypothetical protein